MLASSPSPKALARVLAPKILVSRPEPFTTQGEARELAAEHGWTTPFSLAEWVGQYFYQTGAFVKVALNPGC